jgi:hypothetical protein
MGFLFIAEVKSIRAGKPRQTCVHWNCASPGAALSQEFSLAADGSSALQCGRARHPERVTVV